MSEKYSKLIETQMISPESRIVFVDDGSKDKTWQIITELHESNPTFQGIKLSRNKGHQNALLAGLMTVKEHCDVCISLDADLQDDINAIDEMILKAKEGCEVVYGVRSARDTDTFFRYFILSMAVATAPLFDRSGGRKSALRADNEQCIISNVQ
jgi:glycosyltransferase involved in cell wall biosynthesis